MSYLKFDKTQLVNLEYSLPKEILLANESGVYCSTTIIGCNTRKYHGLLVAPVESIDGGKHVLLSSMQETVVQHDQEFNLGINKYPGEYNPKGHKYSRWFECDPVPKIVYRVGGVVLQKELLLLQDSPRIMVRYTLLEAKSKTFLRLKPFLAFRSIHKLSKTNMYANQRISEVESGIRSRLYDEYPDLYVQSSRKADFITAPDWYKNIEYTKEKQRGYDYHEDLFVPGFFELEIKKGQSVVFSAGLDEIAPNTLARKFTALLGHIEPRESFDDWIKFSAEQLIRKSEKGIEIVPGYHWFGRWGRHALISIPGFSTVIKDKDSSRKVLNSLVRRMKGGRLPDHSPNFTEPVYGAADTSLWFIWVLQQLCGMGSDHKKIYEKYREEIVAVISAYRTGLIPGIEVHNNGLVHSFLPDRSLSWMDSYVNGVPVTQRPGYAVEINALWFNALSFAYQGAVLAGDRKLSGEWKEIIGNIENSFSQVFWDEGYKTLYDYVFNGEPNYDVRPNMLIAVSMENTPLTQEQIKFVLDQVRQELLVAKGIRSFSPRSDDFKPSYEGAHHARDLAYHQGTVWPWLLGAFAEGWLRLHEKSGVSYIKNILKEFEKDLYEHGIGTLSEVYDGNPPHRSCGAISFASSLGELLRIKFLISKYE